MAGRKPHDLEIRTIEHAEGPNVPAGGGYRIRTSPPREPRSQTQQESRDHRKHNNAGQNGHGAQKHSPAEEKH
jgi:hypothetical protein